MSEESIFKTEESFSCISKESVYLMSEAIVIFISDLTHRARKEHIFGNITLTKASIIKGAQQDETFDFLYDILGHIQETICEEVELQSTNSSYFLGQL